MEGRRSTIGRALVAGAAGAALALSALPQGAAAAAVEPVPVEGTNWYWQSQERTSPSTVTGQPCPEPPPHPLVCTDPQAQTPNPHEIGAMPVQVVRGQVEKVASILFDLSMIPDWGASVEKFSFSVIESQDGRDRSQTVGAAGKTILACRITDSWTPTEDGGDDLEDAPPYDADTCVEGKREPALPASPAPPSPPGSAAVVPRWHFDITAFAKIWGQPEDLEKPSPKNGVMLVGKTQPAGETWQIVLKGPRGDDPNTGVDNPSTPQNEATQNEEELNKDNIKAEISYTPNPKPKEPKGKKPSKKKQASGPSGGGGTTGSTGSTGSTGGFGFTDPATPVAPAGPAVFPPTSTDPTMPVPDFAAPVAIAAEQASEETAPSMPAYVWLILPLGLIGISLARAAVLEPIAGKRPDGVVALIRSQNAARRGAPLAPDARSPFAAVTRVLQRAGGSVRTFVRRVITGGS